MIRIAEERQLPFSVKTPNSITQQAISELELGKGQQVNTIDDLIADFNAND